MREKKRVRSQRTQKQRRKFKSKKRKRKKKKVKLLDSGFRMGDYYQVAIAGDWSIIIIFFNVIIIIFFVKFNILNGEVNKSKLCELNYGGN